MLKLLQESDIYSTLTIASEKGAAGIVSQLLSNGADPNIRDKYGRTPAMIAERHDYASTLKLLQNATKRK